MTDSTRTSSKETLLRDLQGLPNSEQIALIYKTCADDAAMMDEMMALLQVTHTRAGTILAEPGKFLIGRVIDKYRIVSLLGEGGMGAVFLAERVGDFSMQVALKLIRAATPELIERFTRERQILASMHHPGIAQIHDGGVDADGTPYIAMEYIDGLPINRYAARNQLGIEARLELFAKVCDAVAYAHQNLVIHRDIKPSNVFVDDNGHPKLLDFGLAAPQAPDSGSLLTLSTAMTPAYASPEQIAQQRLTAATDQYSLGILLYELLTGTHPFMGDAVGAKPTDRSLPIRPSVAAVRVTRQIGEPPPMPLHQLSARLAGDLDAIVLKALRMEPEARYASVGDLAADVRRYIAREPVQAQPPSRAYLLRKFIARHRAETAAALIVTLGLAVAAGIATQAWYKERAALQSMTVAQQEASAINDFVFDLLTSPSPEYSGKDVRVVDVLQTAATAAPQKFKDHPLVLARVLDELGSSYCGLEDVEKGGALLRSSLDLYRRQLGAASEEAFGVEFDSIVCNADTETPQQTLAKWEDYRARVAANPPDKDGRRLGIATGELGHAYIKLVKSGHMEYAAKARDALTESWRYFASTKGDDDPNTIATLHNLAVLDMRTGDLATAKPLLEGNLVRLERLNGPDAFETLATVNALAEIDVKLGRNTEALAETQRCIAGYEHLQGPDGGDVLEQKLKEAHVLTKLARVDEAAAALRDVIQRAGDRPLAADVKRKAAADLDEMGRS